MFPILIHIRILWYVFQYISYVTTNTIPVLVLVRYWDTLHWRAISIRFPSSAVSGYNFNRPHTSLPLPFSDWQHGSNLWRKRTGVYHWSNWFNNDWGFVLWHKWLPAFQTTETRLYKASSVIANRAKKSFTTSQKRRWRTRSTAEDEKV